MKLFITLLMLTFLAGAIHSFDAFAQLQPTMEAFVQESLECDPIPVEVIRKKIQTTNITGPVEVNQIELMILEAIKDNCSLEEMNKFSEAEQKSFLGGYIHKLFSGPPPVYVSEKQKSIQELLKGAPSDVLIFEIDIQDGYFKDASPSAAKALCYTQQQIQSVQFMCMLHPDDVVKSMRAFMTRDASIGYNNNEFTNRYWTGCDDYIILKWTGRMEKHGEVFVIAELIGREKK